MLTTIFFFQLTVHRSSSRANSCLFICTHVCLHAWGRRSPRTISPLPNRRWLSYVIVLRGYSRQQSAAPGYCRHWWWQCQVTITNNWESETHVETLEFPFKSNSNCILALRPAVLFSWLFLLAKHQRVKYSGNISSCSFPHFKSVLKVHQEIKWQTGGRLYQLFPGVTLKAWWTVAMWASLYFKIVILFVIVLFTECV